MENPQEKIYSIGHSNHEINVFLGLLEMHRIDVLVDIRSKPYSRFAVQYNKDAFNAALGKASIKYIFLGNELGGQPRDAYFYNSKGYVLYDKIAQSPGFNEALGRLKSGAAEYRIVLCCSEESPVECHRRLLIGRVLEAQGFHVKHIRGDGSIQNEADLTGKADWTNAQIGFFDEKEDEWKSTQSVLQK